MHRRFIAFAMATLFSVSAAGTLHAAPIAPFHGAATKPASSKLIQFSIRNDSKTPLVLQAGDGQYTIAAGKRLNLKLREGTDVVTVNGTSNQAPGTVITRVSSSLQNNTLAVS